MPDRIYTVGTRAIEEVQHPHLHFRVVCATCDRVFRITDSKSSALRFATETSAQACKGCAR